MERLSLFFCQQYIYHGLPRVAAGCILAGSRESEMEVPDKAGSWAKGFIQPRRPRNERE
jgi:hypothetical protein